MNALKILRERGFIDKTTHDNELDDLFDEKKLTAYIGFDPTANSLHIGSLVPIMSLAHMQRCGHRPIALVGGGTGMIGDPSGKMEMRKIISKEQIEENKKGIKKQLSRFIDFSNDSGLLLDNANWLLGIEYIPFLRDIGKYFNVNKMLKFESCKSRLDSDEGLNFIEFNYTLLQSFDFLKLFKNYDCSIQMGGSDQWGNIVSGIELIRKVERKQAYGITFPLLTTSSGVKMGKTAQGAVWLDGKKTSPYDYYQYWVNIDDADLIRFLKLFTFLPMEEILELDNLQDAKINNAKSILAFEATKLVHGEDNAQKAHQASLSVFGKREIPKELLPSSSILRKSNKANFDAMPSIKVHKAELEKGIIIVDLLHQAFDLSKSASRRLIEQGGVYINNERVENFDFLVSIKNYDDKGELLLRSGKKKYCKVETL